ncbi:ras-related protein rapA-like isoform X2 [Varroa destructor]|nr:ras-related protein rapA-like isoform X2 [Varroa destructor]XP_022650115.1 ras-related protein rapA-like isoform X2 [Varroa destructor]XP_022650116.1 ras-related protein rapA-like isoform X2 [Varroa destructor]
MYDKFFHDPHHHAKEVHHRTLGIADESFELEMHEEHKVSFEQCSHTHSIENADALLVIYSIISRRSFDQAAELVTSLEQRCPETPLLLVANCCDLNYKREVETEEGREVSSDFVEVSAAQEGSTDLQSALESLLRRVAAVRELGQHKRRRSISNVLESIFAWNSRGSFSISV